MSTPVLPPPTTREIQAWRALGRSPDARWIDWAVARLQAGDDGDNLRVLAGLRGPLNFFETTAIADRALVEIGAPQLEGIKAIHAHAADLVRLLISGAEVAPILRELSWLCLENDHDPVLADFYLLHLAYEEARMHGIQFYVSDFDLPETESSISETAREGLRTKANDSP